MTTPRDKIDREARRRELEHKIAISASINLIHTFSRRVVIPSGVVHDGYPEPQP